MSTNAVMNLACGDPEVYEWYKPGYYNSTNYVQHIYPFAQPLTVASTWVVEDKTKKSFSLAKQLVKDKWVTASKIDDFIKLVEMIESHL